MGLVVLSAATGLVSPPAGRAGSRACHATQPRGEDQRQGAQVRPAEQRARELHRAQSSSAFRRGPSLSATWRVEPGSAGYLVGGTAVNAGRLDEYDP